MTEDEAKQKWCQASASGESFKCVASKCMAWRWLPFRAEDQAYIDALKLCETTRKMKPAIAARYVNAHRAEFGLPTEPFEGYCGLAGKPEVR